MQTNVIFFSDFHWHDLGFLGKINCRDLAKKFKIIQDLGKKTKTPSTGQIQINSSSRLSRTSKADSFHVTTS